MSSIRNAGDNSVQSAWYGEAVNKYISDLCAHMAWVAAQDLARTAAKDVPTDTGALRRSARVTMHSLPNAAAVYLAIKSGGPRLDASLSDSTQAPLTVQTRNPKAYVSFNTPYAIMVHENLTRGTAVMGLGAPKSGRGKGRAGQNEYRLRRRNARVGKEQGSPKWLERAVPRVQSRWRHYLARALRRVGRVTVWQNSP